MGKIEKKNKLERFLKVTILLFTSLRAFFELAKIVLSLVAKA